MTMARIVDRLGMERVLTFGLALGAFGALATGSLAAPLWALSALIFVAGLGSASQAGIKELSGFQSNLSCTHARDRLWVGFGRGASRCDSGAARWWLNARPRVPGGTTSSCTGFTASDDKMPGLARMAVLTSAVVGRDP